MVLLSLAPLDSLHIRGRIYGHFAVVGATEDQSAHLPSKPIDDRVKSYFCHVLVLAFVIMKFIPSPPRLNRRIVRLRGRYSDGSRCVRESCTCPVLTLYLSCTVLGVSGLLFKELLKFPSNVPFPIVVGCFGNSSCQSVAEDRGGGVYR